MYAGFQDDFSDRFGLAIESPEDLKLLFRFDAAFLAFTLNYPSSSQYCLTLSCAWEVGMKALAVQHYLHASPQQEDLVLTA